MRLRLAIPMLLTLDAASGCENSKPAPAPTTIQKSVEICTADFEVEITTGPEAGLKLAGKMALAPVGPALLGQLTADGATYDVVATQSDKQIVVSLTLADGRKIVGVGAAPATPCTGPLEGIAIGPSLDPAFAVASPNTSSGHWLATAYAAKTVDYTVKLSGGLTSSDFKFESYASVQKDCVNKSTGGRETITCRDGKDPVRDAVANFFGVPYCADLAESCKAVGGELVEPETPNQN